MKPGTALLLPTALAAVLVSSVHAGEASSERVRAFAALPNWTGMWETEAARRLLVSATGIQPPKLWGSPPYNAEWQKKTEHAGPRAPAGPVDLPPGGKECGTGGFPALMEYVVPDLMFEMLVTPEQTLLLTNNGGVRHIYTDGRPHPKAEDLWPTEEGDSIGRWEGQTLVIDTIARKAGRVGPLPGTAELSEQAHFTERLRQLDGDTLQNEMTIDDPERFAHPWKLTIRYKRVTGLNRMIAVNCTENDRNPVVNGGLVIEPP